MQETVARAETAAVLADFGIELADGGLILMTDFAKASRPSQLRAGGGSRPGGGVVDVRPRAVPEAAPGRRCGRRAVEIFEIEIRRRWWRVQTNRRQSGPLAIPRPYRHSVDPSSDDARRCSSAGRRAGNVSPPRSMPAQDGCFSAAPLRARPCCDWLRAKRSTSRNPVSRPMMPAPFSGWGSSSWKQTSFRLRCSLNWPRSSTSLNKSGRLPSLQRRCAPKHVAAMCQAAQEKLPSETYPGLEQIWSQHLGAEIVASASAILTNIETLVADAYGEARPRG
jgi:hypothetical protein